MREMKQIEICNTVMECLNDLPYTKECTVRGSLATNHWDQYSDIDLRIDVSGSDNGKVVLMLLMNYTA